MKNALSPTVNCTGISTENGYKTQHQLWEKSRNGTSYKRSCSSLLTQESPEVGWSPCPSASRWGQGHYSDSRLLTALTAGSDCGGTSSLVPGWADSAAERPPDAPSTAHAPVVVMICMSKIADINFFFFHYLMVSDLVKKKNHKAKQTFCSLINTPLIHTELMNTILVWSLDKMITDHYESQCHLFPYASLQKHWKRRANAWTIHIQGQITKIV